MIKREEREVRKAGRGEQREVEDRGGCERGGERRKREEEERERDRSRCPPVCSGVLSLSLCFQGRQMVET